MDFPLFVQEIYTNCKNFGIKPAIVFSWIKDLFDGYSSSNISSSFIDGQNMEEEETIQNQRYLIEMYPFLLL